jgi:hypothetical protein
MEETQVKYYKIVAVAALTPPPLWIMWRKVELSLWQAVEAISFDRRRGPHTL